ncbi:MAG: hypothetical protein V1839_01675, partial [archaeon]
MTTRQPIITVLGRPVSSSTTHFNLERLIKNTKIISMSGKTEHILNYELTRDFIKVWYKTGPGQFEAYNALLPKYIPLNGET